MGWTSAGRGDMRRSRNLSDLADKIAARDNIEAAPKSFTVPATGARSRLLTDRFKEFVNALDFCVADGVTDDYNAIIAARDEAISSGKSLVFPDGNYAFGTTIEFAKKNLNILAMGPNVRLLHTGSGRAVSFDGSTDTGGSSWNQVFGGAHRFNIIGNTNTSDLLFTKLVHRSKFLANVRDGECGWRNDNTVLNEMDIVCSANEAAFVKRPNWGAFLNELYASPRCTLIIEGVGVLSNVGVHLESGFNNTFYGTSEGNMFGGVYIGAGAVRNTFIGFDCEVNGELPDWIITGDRNTFINCTGEFTASGSTLAGKRNVFVGCHFSGMQVVSESGYNRFDRCNLEVPTSSEQGFADTDATTEIWECVGVANKAPRYGALAYKAKAAVSDIDATGSPGAETWLRGDGQWASHPVKSVPFGGSSAGTTIAAGETKYVAYAMDGNEGFVYVPLGIAGTFKNLRVLSDDSPGAGETYTATVRKTLADTDLTCTIPEGTNTAADLTHSAHFNAGDRLAIKVVASSGAATTPIMWSIEFVPD